MKKTLKKLSAHLHGNIVDAEVLAENINGAALYKAHDENGETRYVIEGEAGELLGGTENLEDALITWGK